MRKPVVVTLATLATATVLAFVAARPGTASAAPTHDVLVVNPPDAPLPVAQREEPFHLTAAIDFVDGSSGHGRVTLVNATRRMVVDHVSARWESDPNAEADLMLLLEQQGRKTAAMHEIPLTNTWVYPDDIAYGNVPFHMRQTASQPMHLIIDAGETLTFFCERQYGDNARVSVSVSGHYASAK